jgi:hypothetical protein
MRQFPASRFLSRTALTVTAAATAIATSAPGAAAQQPRAAAPHPPTADSLRGIEARGRELAEYDSAAWHGTDAVMALRPDRRLANRYIARRTADGGWEVAFGMLTAGRDTFLVRYRAVSAPDAAPHRFRGETLERAEADTGYYARAARAIDLATRDFGTTTRPYNVAVLPTPDGAWWVYPMPAQVQAGVYPLGGDARYTISADGSAIVVKRRLHQAVLEYDGRTGAPPGQTVAAGTHTAVLADVPEDTDVFHVLVRQPKVPEYIATDAFVYRITPDGTITLMGRREDILGK